MDGTLTVPNLDFGEMYRRCGVPKEKDILAELAFMAPQRRAETAAIIDEMEAEGARTMVLMPGAAECARFLAAKGVPMAMVTRNCAATVREFYRRLWVPEGLAHFAPAVSRDGVLTPGAEGRASLDGLPAKPHPASLLEIARLWGVPAGPELLMVGDSPSNDVAFGRAAGVASALLDSGRKYFEGGLGEHVPDHLVQNLDELRELLEASYGFEE
mmetsp:Transcript_92149/g.298052  ORF Transcript_92149/g.298052 Transcript_92149/m.298052 type:complete len:214 (-) Transcript_92149:485-1126(-)